MALIPCPKCGNAVSSLAQYCPHCGAPIAAQRYRQPSVEPEKKYKNNSLIPWLIVGILAAMVVGGGITYMLLSHSSNRDADSTSVASSNVSEVGEVEVVPSMASEPVEEVKETQPVTPERETPARDVETRDKVVVPDYEGGHDMGFSSSKHHHLEGYMTDDKGDHAIELDFNCNNGKVSDVVYKNVKYGGKIHMRCTSFTSSSISLAGKDGSKSFTMDLNYDGDGDFKGDAWVGDKYLSVTLYVNCSH